tara:strand:+ start:108 stop:446 length:339 start_codon:yes stop_codon:yes gene_type:complete
MAKTAAWQRKEGKNPTGGLNEKGRRSYRRENPGSKLAAPVTGKVKKGSKAAKRRKSFCARMSGMKGPLKKNGKPTRKLLALRKWKCRNYKKSEMGGKVVHTYCPSKNLMQQD